MPSVIIGPRPRSHPMLLDHLEFAGCEQAFESFLLRLGAGPARYVAAAGDRIAGIGGGKQRNLIRVSTLQE